MLTKHQHTFFIKRIFIQTFGKVLSLCISVAGGPNFVVVIDVADLKAACIEELVSSTC